MNGIAYFHTRLAAAEHPAGITVSRRMSLPDGDFRITEYCWDYSLWFVDADKFTSDERQAAYTFGLHCGVIPATGEA